MIVPREIYLMTGNAGKLAAATQAFAATEIHIVQVDLNISEPQAASSAEIARVMACAAYQQLQQPVMREDHSFTIEGLWMPGPFVAYIERRMPVSTLRQIVRSLGCTNAVYELALCYVASSDQIIELTTQVPIIIDTEADLSDVGGNWDALMRFPEESRVFSQYPSSERTMAWASNYQELAKRIRS
jgi:inosine/xanthosine triphosphate pyrophosphatase family protein